MCHWPIGKPTNRRPFRSVPEPSKLDRWVRLPHGTLNGKLFGDRLTVGYLTLNQVIEVRILFPELGEVRANIALSFAIPDPG